MDKNIIMSSPIPQNILDKMQLSISQYLRERTKPFMNQTAVINADTGARQTYEEIFRKSYEISNFLKELGCCKNTIIAIICENRPEIFSIMFGAFHIGVICTFIHAEESPTEIEHDLYVSQPKIIFISNATASKIEKIPSKHFSINNIINIDVDNCVPKIKTQLDLFDNTISPTDTAIIVFSSGTTGLPKGIKLNHKAFVYLMELDKAGEIFYSPCGSILPLFGPLAHISSLLVIFVNFSSGKILLPVKSITEETFMKYVLKYHLQEVFMSTSFFISLSKHCLSAYEKSDLKIIIHGGRFIKEEVEERARRCFNKSKIIKWYGLSETASVCIKTNVDSKGLKTDSMGTLIPGMMAKVVDLCDKTTLGPFQEGELWLKGPTLMNGYCLNEFNNDLGIDEHSWFPTGDLVYYDNDHYFYFVDRIKELIKHSERHVPPVELEMVLLELDTVKEVAVVGIPDEVTGELPRAYIVKKSGHDGVTELEIQQYVEKKMSWWKQLRGGVIFVEELPKTPFGKIKRKEIKKWL